MTKANLQRLWPSYQSHNIYCLHKSGEVCTQFQEKFLSCYGCNLHWPQLNEACTQFASYTLTLVAKDTWYCLYQLQSSIGYAPNSRKTTMHFGSLVWTPNQTSNHGKTMQRRPTLDNKHFGLVHTAVSCTWPELTVLVDTWQSPHTIGCTQDALPYSSKTVSKKVARSSN